MSRIITLDDFIETYTKLNQRGLGFISSKFNFNEIKRAKTAFNHIDTKSANWWIIPKIKERWNLLITGDKNIGPEEFTINTFLKDKQNLKMLSLGSGSCTSELKFSMHSVFDEILCTDIAEKPLIEAEKISKKKNLNNIKFKIQDANNFSFPENYYDIVYFKASLHHFKNVESLLSKHINKTLKKDGILIIDEFVGPTRFQFPKEQIKSINEAIQLIPKKFRKRYKLNLYKNKIYGSGLIRMILADPSECIDSENILPSIHKHYKTVYEAGYGGNIIKMALKDLAHHFIELNEEKENVLNNLFHFENEYLKTHPSDFVFGIYKPNITSF
tara:strand:+ start:38532 stop:39518 length:987 start_codon:yes stop_codon:yes gene_type:complete